MKGRESDWQAQLVNLPAEELTRDVVAVGFEAYVIDRAGYADFGAQIERDISAATGRQPQVSGDGRWSFFDLTGLRTRFGTEAELEAIETALLDHPRLSLEGCSGWEGTGSDQFSWCSAHGAFTMVDPAPDGRPVELRATVVAPAGSGTLDVSVGGTTSTIQIGPGATPLVLSVPSGEAVRVAFQANVSAVQAPGDPRDLRFQLIFPQLTRL
jgi:hypothetical protein